MKLKQYAKRMLATVLSTSCILVTMPFYTVAYDEKVPAEQAVAVEEQFSEENQNEVDRVVCFDCETGEENVLEIPKGLYDNCITEGYAGDDGGGISPASIIDGDQSTRVSSTISYPYRTVMQTQVVSGGNVYYGSAFMVSPTRVLTAAHCVYNKEDGTVFRDIEFIPGKNGSYEPYERFRATQIYINYDFMYTDKDVGETDWAIVELDFPIGDLLGYMPLSTSAVALDSQAVVLGYPGGNDKIGYQYRAPGKITNASYYELQYNCDTVGGTSGGPVINSSNQIIGINTYEVGTQYNGGPKISGSMYAAIMGYSHFDLGTYRTVSGDFDGDGRDDMASIDAYENNWAQINVKLSKGNIFSEKQTWYGADKKTDYNANAVSGRVVSGDFNGDGKDDIAAMYRYGENAAQIHVWISTGTSFKDWSVWYSDMSTYSPDRVTNRMVAGDFNGDGKDDIAAMFKYGENSAEIHIWPSTGSGFPIWQTWYSDRATYQPDRVTGRMAAGDFNGDGKDDIAAMFKYGENAAQIHVWISAGSSLNEWKSWYSDMSGYQADLVTGRFVAGKFDKDSKADIAANYAYNDGLRTLVFLSKTTYFEDWIYW